MLDNNNNYEVKNLNFLHIPKLDHPIEFSLFTCNFCTPYLYKMTYIVHVYEHPTMIVTANDFDLKIVRLLYSQVYLDIDFRKSR